jgi:DNA-binding NtrC family response regulator
MATAKILFVDDNDLYLTATAKLLSRRGYEVVPATRPSEALEIVKNSLPFDLVVSDITMPEMSGTDLIREIAHLSPGIARLLITGGKVDLAELPDGVAVLRKPISTEDMICAIEAVLDVQRFKIEH